MAWMWPCACRSSKTREGRQFWDAEGDPGETREGFLEEEAAERVPEA